MAEIEKMGERVARHAEARGRVEKKVARAACACAGRWCWGQRRCCRTTCRMPVRANALVLIDVLRAYQHVNSCTCAGTSVREMTWRERTANAAETTVRRGRVGRSAMRARYRIITAECHRERFHPLCVFSGRCCEQTLFPRSVPWPVAGALLRLREQQRPAQAPPQQPRV